MSMPRALHSLSTMTALLRIAALLVPAHKRAEWLAEWRAELCHVCRVCNQQTPASLHSEQDVLAFALGAFKDAALLRCFDLSAVSRRLLHDGSPVRCELTLIALLAASLLLALVLPNVRRQIEPLPYPHADQLATLSRKGSPALLPSVPLADYQACARSRRHRFNGIAFYQPLTKRVHIGRRTTAEIPIARATANLFTVLQVHLATENARATATAPSARVVLTRSASRRYFNSDPHALGQHVRIAGHDAVITAILADDDWKLPGHFDLWLLEPEQTISALPAYTRGFAIARVANFPAERDGRRELVFARGGNRYDVFECVTLAEQSREPLSVFLFTLLLACLALPATTPLPLGEYPASHFQLRWSTRLRRWAFLVSKLGFIVAIVYCATLDLAYSGSLSAGASQYVQLVSSFPALLLAFRWALRDQRRRCPVCLRSLTNPARVGQFSRSFLAWNGTELVCLGGHGLLHVPDIPTSWFSTQRWLYLDPSWSSLFPAATLAPSGML